MKNFIVIEGTDGSGKETQAKLLIERLNQEKIKAKYVTFPMYDTPTGKIVGGPYLGKEYICNGWFKEGATNVDAMVASLYFAADRKYNMSIIENCLINNEIVICDRYVDSNLAHQSAKMSDIKERLKFYKKIEELEYGILELVKPSLTIFLHLPYSESIKAIEKRKEAKDEHEANVNHLKNAENSYLELAQLHNYLTIDCMKSETERKTINEIHEEVYTHVKKLIK